MPETKLRKGYSRDWILKAVEDVLIRFERQKITGRIMPIIDTSQGTISSAKIRQEVGVVKQ